jgi:NAD(P)-dependent dehydrogenase (short-subunit alcohol dehydrogenase family)
LHYDHVDIDDQQPRLPKRLFQNGVYLITGGLGGIGFEVAKELARQYQARLALVNRTPLPPRGEWADWLRTHEYDDRISQSIKKLQQLESQGAQVTVYSGDVIDRDRMRDIVRQITTLYGSIQGVIHAAGTLRDSLVQMKNQGEVEEVFAPKIYGTLVLDEIFEHLPLDFFVVFSSISTAIAPVGQIDYVAANAFLNAYAQSRNSTSNRYTLSVNWGVWNEVPREWVTQTQNLWAKKRPRRDTHSLNCILGPHKTEANCIPSRCNFRLSKNGYSTNTGPKPGKRYCQVPPTLSWREQLYRNAVKPRYLRFAI